MFSLGGVRVDAIRQCDLLQLLKESVAQRNKCLILSHNLHSLYLYEKLQDFRTFYQTADCVYIDGMPVIWLSKLAGHPVAEDHRITLLDSMEVVVREAANLGSRVFYLGGTEQTLQAGMQELVRQFPHLKIAGRNGYFNMESESVAVVEQINEARPDFLFVGLGMPLQERWLASYYSQLDVPVVFTCGATLSYITGDSYRPPRWASNLGLYGLMRLLHEPKRLWRRYLIEPIYLAWKLGPRILKQGLKSKVNRK
jgi:N-acetylglucosaminyldiphosphoundecaprenol N-acetyl-beta-D-mannosaminyltransferase